MWALIVNNGLYCKGNREQITLAFDVNTLSAKKFEEKYACSNHTYKTVKLQYQMKGIDSTATLRIAMIHKSKDLI